MGVGLRIVRLTNDRPKRRKVREGEFFRVELVDGRCVLGRVAVLGVEAEYENEGDLCAVYLFKPELSSDTIPREASLNDLLTYPILTDRETVCGFPLVGYRAFTAGERYKRHFFGEGEMYYDEHNREVSREEMNDANYFNEVCSHDVHIDAGIEYEIAQALGEEVDNTPLAPEEMETLLRGMQSVLLIIPAPPDDDEEEFGLDLVEDPLIEAVEDSGEGEWVGHGFDADLSQCDVQFEGDPEKLCGALLPALERLSLPAGSYLLVGGKNPRRIDL